MFWIIIELIVFVASVGISVIVILEEPTDLKRYTLLTTVLLLGIGIARRAKSNEGKKQKLVYVNTLAGFLSKGNELRALRDQDPLPIQEHNDWVEEVKGYLNESGKSYLVARFSDTSGITFFGDGSKRSEFSNSLTGRIQRLHEFISESET